MDWWLRKGPYMTMGIFCLLGMFYQERYALLFQVLNWAYTFGDNLGWIFLYKWLPWFFTVLLGDVQIEHMYGTVKACNMAWGSP